MLENERPSNLRGESCHVCGEPEPVIIPGYDLFPRLTSDSKPWPPGGRLIMCNSCGCVQKVIDQEWQSEVKKLYDAYSIYYQSDGAEQSVFPETSGRATSRSTRVVECLHRHVTLPVIGRLLDIGCGNGALLNAFARRNPAWTLAGTELNEKYRQNIEAIQNVESLHTCAPHQVPGTFDLITMIHVLEHIADPRQFLISLREKLHPAGFLVIEVPNYLENPFDLLIADHSTHFSVATVSRLLGESGFKISHLASDWVSKELSVIACIAHDSSGPTKPLSFPSFQETTSFLLWLASVADAAKKLSAEENFGIFGTSNAATWLFEAVNGRADFFIDEDPARIGRQHLGRPVYHPTQTPAGSRTLIALPTPIAWKIQERMKTLGLSGQFFTPPPMPGFPSDKY